MNHDQTPVSLDFDSVGPFGDSPCVNPYAFPTPSEAQATLGQVVAISTRGVRIDHHGDTPLTPGQHLTLMLTYQQTRVELQARVAHVLPRGLRHQTLGLIFDPLTDDQRDALQRLLTVDHRQLKVA